MMAWWRIGDRPLSLSVVVKSLYQNKLTLTRAKWPRLSIRMIWYKVTCMNTHAYIASSHWDCAHAYLSIYTCLHIYPLFNTVRSCIRTNVKLRHEKLIWFCANYSSRLRNCEKEINENSISLLSVYDDLLRPSATEPRHQQLPCGATLEKCCLGIAFVNAPAQGLF